MSIQIGVRAPREATGKPASHFPSHARGFKTNRNSEALPEHVKLHCRSTSPPVRCLSDLNHLLESTKNLHVLRRARSIAQAYGNRLAADIIDAYISAATGDGTPSPIDELAALMGVAAHVHTTDTTGRGSDGSASQDLTGF